MKLGLQTEVETVALACELKVRGVPLPGGVWGLAQKGARLAVAPLVSAGLEVCQIGAFDFNPLSADRARQAKLRDVLEKAIPEAPATGCPFIVIGGGNYEPSAAGDPLGHPDNFTEAGLDALARELAPWVKRAECHGVKLVVEPEIHWVVSTPERFLRLKEKVGSEALMVNLDVCNLFNWEAMWQPTETVTHLCKTLAGHYSAVHCKDLTVRAGAHLHIDEAPFGKGRVDWKTALRFIGETLPEEGYVILEHVKTAEHARSGVALLRDRVRSAGFAFKEE